MADGSPDLVDEIIAAHGGSELWNRIEWLEADLSAGGFLFTAKRRPLLNRIRVQASTGEPRFLFHNYPYAGETGELIGNREVRILESDGSVRERRSQPREVFKGLRRSLWWDDLDFLYFGGYAIWNYLVTPFIFTREGFNFEYLGEQRTLEGIFFRLRVKFPDDIPTHCATQTFYFDERRLIGRLDYTAEVVGRWAHAAHFCDEYKEFSGLKIPVRRRVKPLIFNHLMSRPTLVAIDIHDIRIHFAGGGADAKQLERRF